MLLTAPATPRLKLVLVEDDATVRQFVKEAVEKTGHEVIGEAATGTDMVQTVLALDPDLVVFDIHLPRVNGLEALRQIYQERGVAAVAITGDRDQELVRRALEEHVLAYLVKPVEADQLAPALLVAWARFEEMRHLADENETLRQTLQHRKLIERAKGALMQRLRVEEDDAFRRIRTFASAHNLKLVDAARRLLQVEEVFGQFDKP